MITLDRFHHQQFCLEALQEVRREYRREQMTQDANAREEHRLMMSPDKWTETQKERAEILFREFPDIKTAFSLTHSLRMIFSQRCSKDKGAESLHSWYTKVGEFGNKAFNDIAAAMYDRENDILENVP